MRGIFRVLSICLLTAIVAGSVEAVSFAEGTAVAAMKTSETLDWSFSPAYLDALQGNTYFNTYAYDSSRKYTRRVIYKDQHDQWIALSDRYSYIFAQSKDQIYLLPQDVYYSDSGSPVSFLYDAATGKVDVKTEFEPLKRDGYGILTLSHYDKKAWEPHSNNYYITKNRSLYIHNDRTGEIKELNISGFNFYYQTNEGKLLISAYSEQDKQNEIRLIDPVSLESRQIILASLRDYDATSNKLLFAYNEPMRKEYIYDLSTGTIHLATKQELQLFYSPRNSSQSITDRAQVPDVLPPADLQPQLLPVQKLTENRHAAGTIVINGAAIQLPFAFQRDGSTYVPVEALSGPLQVKAAKLTDVASSSYRFQVSWGRASIVVDDKTSRVYANRLYISIEQLRKLGLKIQSLSWRSE